jgi:glucose uptake protein GlcU
MSLLISTGYAVIAFHEPFGIIKILGLALAVVAIFLITRSDRTIESARKNRKYLWLPFGTLVFSGIIESVLYHVHAETLTIHGDIVFTTYAFSIGACIGTVVVVIRAWRGIHKLTVRDLLGGVVLGIPNFFTIYLILALLHSGFPGSVLYPVLNTLVLTLTAVTGMYFFREKLTKVNIIGICVAVVAILLFSFAK